MRRVERLTKKLRKLKQGKTRKKNVVELSKNVRIIGHGFNPFQIETN